MEVKPCPYGIHTPEQEERIVTETANWQARRRERLTEPPRTPLLDRINGVYEEEPVLSTPLTWMERMARR